MSTLIVFLAILAIVLIGHAARETGRRSTGPTWFDIMPTLTESKKRRTRAQQTRRHGARRYGR